MNALNTLHNYNFDSTSKMSSTNNNIEAVANQMPTGGSGEFNPKPAGVGRENHDGVSCELNKHSSQTNLESNNQAAQARCPDWQRRRP